MKKHRLKEIKMSSLNAIIKTWKKNQEQGIRVIAFGSSNTELHWHSLGHFNWFSWLSSSMREWIGRHIVTINQGVSGETARDLVNRLERDILDFIPNLVIITIGGNDTWKGLTVTEYKQHLSLIITKLRSRNAIPVLQTYYCLLYNSMPDVFKRFPELVEVNRGLSKDKSVPLIDQYKYFSPFYEQDPEAYRKIMLDGLHVNQIGNALMGIIACRTFGLPDPIFYKDKGQIKTYLQLMSKYSNIPPRVPKKEW
jgi:lysophospholipase L1-like esterase